jgi:hypothetical protein
LLVQPNLILFEPLHDTLDKLQVPALLARADEVIE